MDVRTTKVKKELCSKCWDYQNYNAQIKYIISQNEYNSDFFIFGNK